MASTSMMWELLKNYNSMMVKRRDCNATLTHDPFSLTNVHCYKDSGLAHERAMGITLDTRTGKKKKGVAPIYKVTLKHKKNFMGKKAKGPNRRTTNTFTTVLPLKKGPNQAAKVIQGMKTFRTDMHKAALRRVAAIHQLAIHKTAIKKVEKKPEEKKMA